MLKTILSVSGKPGLYKLVSQAKNMIIAESLADKKRIPIYAHQKVISLGDIAMFTIEKEVPLAEVLAAVKKEEAGKVCKIDPKAETKILSDYFATVLPTYDRERVRPGDIKKLITWYNLLVTTENDNFDSEETPQAE